MQETESKEKSYNKIEAEETWEETLEMSNKIEKIHTFDELEQTLL